MIRRLPLVVAVIALAALALSAILLARSDGDVRDASLIAGMGYLRTETGATIDTVATREFRPVGASFSGGYDPAAHWFRIRLRPPANGGQVLLGIYPPFLDHVTLFAADGGGRWITQESGDGVPMARRGWKAASLGFQIEPRDEGSVYYLRVVTESTAQLFVTARPIRNELAHESRRMAGHAILLSVMWGALIMALLQLLYRPSLTDVLLVAGTGSYMVYSVFLLGYGQSAHPDWSPTVLGRITDILYFVTVAANLGFHRVFLTRMKPAPLSLFFTDALICGSGLALLAYLSGFQARSFEANSAVVLLGAVALAVMAFTAHEGADPPLRLVRLFYALFALLSVAWMLLNLGLIPAVTLLRYPVEIQGLLNVLLVLSLVVSRSWSQQRKLADQKSRLRDAELRRAHAARSADLKDKLLNMLAHEVRNHLAIIRISAESVFAGDDRQQALSVTRNLEATITDCIRLAWLERGDLLPKAGSTDLETLVLEVLAEVLDEDRIDLGETETEAVLAHDGEMLRTALFNIFREIDGALAPDARIRIDIARDAPAPQESWSVRIAARTLRRWPAPWNPEYEAYPDRTGLSLAIAKGMIELMGGAVAFRQGEEEIECRVSLPASSTSS